MRTIMEGRPVGLTYNLLEIGAGTVWATVVRDVRGLGRWAVPSKVPIDEANRAIVYHHTAGGHTGWVKPIQQLAMMELMRAEAPWGLPYNFIVFPQKVGKVWYLNDVDQSWPHTYGGNGACAIAAWGNYSIEQPGEELIVRMLRLGDALASMWGRWLPEYQHRDFTPTECPGTNLWRPLPSRARQREA